MLTQTENMVPLPSAYQEQQNTNYGWEECIQTILKPLFYTDTFWDNLYYRNIWNLEIKVEEWFLANRSNVEPFLETSYHHPISFAN